MDKPINCQNRPKAHSPPCNSYLQENQSRTSKLSLHRLVMHELVHQITETSIRTHQLCRWADKIVGGMLHAPKPTIFSYPILLIQPIRYLGCAIQHGIIVAGDARDSLTKTCGFGNLLCMDWMKLIALLLFVP